MKPQESEAGSTSVGDKEDNASAGAEQRSHSPIIRRAAAFRMKYRKDRARLPVSQVGFHPANRNGQPPSSDRCISLLKDILALGFDAEEPHHGGVCVEAKQGCLQLNKFNTEAVEGNERMAPVDAGSLRYGSLSHSHLNQILKNIKAGARADVPSICDGEGRLSIRKLRAISPEFTEVVELGCTWEILDAKMEKEEPTAVDDIQAALNAKSSLFLMAHEMQAIAKVMDITNALATAGQAVAWGTVQKRLRWTMPGFANDDAFLELFRFVVELGAGSAPFLNDLRVFHENYVDAKQRRIRLRTLENANMIPTDCPHMKIAALKTIYSVPKSRIVDGFCAPFKKANLAELLKAPAMRTVFDQAERVLRYYHVECDKAGVWKNRTSKAQFLANVDKDVFRVVLYCNVDDKEDKAAPVGTGNDRLELLYNIAGRFHERLTRVATQVPKIPWTPPAAASQAASSAAPVGIPPPSQEQRANDLAVKIMTFDAQGKAQESERHAGASSGEEFRWQEFMQTDSAMTSSRQDLVQMLVCSACTRLRGVASLVPESALSIQKRDTKVGVYAAAAMPCGSLKLAPLVKGSSSISWKELPFSLAVQVQGHRIGSFTAFINGSATLPKLKSAPSVEGGMREDHAWKPNCFPWPFWLVRRSSMDRRCNCVLQNAVVRDIMMSEMDRKDPDSDVVEITLPIMTNTKQIEEGDELVVHWEAKQDQKNKKEANALDKWAPIARKMKSQRIEQSE